MLSKHSTIAKCNARVVRKGLSHLLVKSNSCQAQIESLVSRM